jgi:hypothetical protein
LILHLGLPVVVIPSLGIIAIIPLLVNIAPIPMIVASFGARPLASFRAATLASFGHPTTIDFMGIVAPTPMIVASFRAEDWLRFASHAGLSRRSHDPSGSSGQSLDPARAKKSRESWLRSAHGPRFRSFGIQDKTESVAPRIGFGFGS